MVLHLALEVDGAGAHPGAACRDLRPRRAAAVRRPPAPHGGRRGERRGHVRDLRRRPRRARPRRRGHPRGVRRALTSRIGLVPLAHPGRDRAVPPGQPSGGAGPRHDGPLGLARRRRTGPGSPCSARPTRGRGARTCSTRPVTWSAWSASCGTRGTTTPSSGTPRRAGSIDRDRLHYVDFTGAPFTVKGSAIVPRPPRASPSCSARTGRYPRSRSTSRWSGGDGRSAGLRGAGTPRILAEVEVAFDTARGTAVDRVAALAGTHPAGRARCGGRAAPTGSSRCCTRLQGGVDSVRLHPVVLEEDLALLSSYVVPRPGSAAA